MIKVFSPYYKTIPWLSPSSELVPEKYILNIYIWSGLKADVPTSTTYQQENVNPLGKIVDSEVNISGFIKSFINTNFITNTETSINDANGLVWVKTEVIYYIGGVAQTPEFVEVQGATNGYAYGIEGTNQLTPSNNYLATTVEQKVSSNGVYICSFIADEIEDTVIRVESENVSKEFTKLASTNSNDLIQSIFVDVSEFNQDYYIEIYKDDVLINTLLITNELRYTPIDIAFRNKEGQLQTITFFKEKLSSLKVSKESYETSSGQPINGVHKYKDYNVNGKESFSVQSGFIKEDNNEVFTQLLLTDRVWQVLGGSYIPLNLGTESIEYKSLNKDRLLNYKIDFKYSFSKINNI